MSKVAGPRSGEGGGIPFAIEGTTSNTKFIPDVGGAVAGVAKDQLRHAAKGQVPEASNVTKGLGGILGKEEAVTTGFGSRHAQNSLLPILGICSIERPAKALKLDTPEFNFRLLWI